jgi:D-alanine-D-alanine ligase
MQRTTVLLLFGGESSEHDVSVSSARNVYAAIDDEKYDVILGYIDQQGKWWLLDTFGMQIDTHGAPQLLPALGSGGFVTMPGQQVMRPQVILPILHGKNGEDGSVQGLAQLLHIPMVGCDIAASAVAMNKLLTKQLLQSHHIDVVPYVTHMEHQPAPEFHKLTMTLGCPLFVKPANGGSSIGVTKVYSEEEFIDALQLAHHHDAIVLIEQAIAARELEVGVLGTAPHYRISAVGEIITDADFYDYEDKYVSGTSNVQIPADIDDHVASRIRTLAGRIYEIVGCQGLSRVDFFLSEDGKLYLNEINTMPGFTNISMYPKLWREQGVSYPELIELLLRDASSRATIEPTVEEE